MMFRFLNALDRSCWTVMTFCAHLKASSESDFWCPPFLDISFSLVHQSSACPQTYRPRIILGPALIFPQHAVHSASKHDFSILKLTNNIRLAWILTFKFCCDLKRFQLHFLSLKLLFARKTAWVRLRLCILDELEILHKIRQILPIPISSLQG